MNKFYIILCIFCFSTHSVYSQSWNISVDPSHVTCRGANDGQINLMVDGEDQVSDTLYNWEWQDSGGHVFDTMSDPVKSLEPGTYRVRVTRISDGSSASAIAQIRESDSALVISGNVVQENFCAGDAAGIIQATASGGSGDYLFGLGRGHNPAEPDYTEGYADNGGRFESLPSGTYAVWLRDSRGCAVRTPSFTITEPQPIAVVYEATNPGCDDTAGEIAINSISGGTPYDVNQAGSFNFQLEWKNASNDSTIAKNKASVTGLPSGSYQVIVTDKNECVHAVRIELERGFKFDVVERRNISCNKEKDGLIKIDLGSSRPTVQEPFSISVKDSEGNEITSMARSGVKSGEVIFSNLGPARYTIEVTDALGCVKEQQAVINMPDELRLEEIAVTDVKCTGSKTGQIYMIVSGGSGNYRFSIDSGATYANEPVFGQLPAGAYHLFLRDDAGCRLNAGEVEITEPPTGYQVEEVKVTDVLCNGKRDGSVEIFFSETTSPSHLDERNDILWLNEAGEVIQKGSQIISGLGAGTYEVRISDDFGCNFSKQVMVNKKYELMADFSMEAPRLAVDYPVAFRDKSLGAGIVSRLWDFGNGQGSVEQDPQISYDKPGSYVVELSIRNELGCSTKAQDTITIEKGFQFVVPTAFSPNDDRLNDTFVPTFDNISELRMRIINKDGIEVYASDELFAGWNGRYNGEDVPQGIYYYEMEYTTGSGSTRKKKGKVFLLR